MSVLSFAFHSPSHPTLPKLPLPQDQIDVLQTRADQASALRSAADADYKDISAQLQTERFRVETLMVGGITL